MQILNLEAWPVTRDTIAYAITVFLLILTLRDGRIEWYEALILVLSYFLYILGKFMIYAYIIKLILHYFLLFFLSKVSKKIY